MAESATSAHYDYGLGRRKAAIATVRLIKGQGAVVVNGQPIGQYFNNASLESIVGEPLVMAGLDKKLDASLQVKGGGKRGQADAARLAIARALNELNPDLRPTLKKAGFLTRDPREKERKKYGLKKARKAPQFSKR
jgi:small subunit ribosomal protein S9